MSIRHNQKERYNKEDLIFYSNCMFEAPEETPVVPVGEAEELDPRALTPAEREALGLEEETLETEETA